MRPLNGDGMMLTCPYCEIPLRAVPEGVTVQQEQGVLFVAMSCARCNVEVELVAGITQPLCLKFDNEVFILPSMAAGLP